MSDDVLNPKWPELERFAKEDGLSDENKATLYRLTGRGHRPHKYTAEQWRKIWQAVGHAFSG